MKKYMQNHIGETFTTNERLGEYKAKIIDGGSKQKKCTIKIGNWTKEVFYMQLKKGSIQYPYHKSVFGIGYLGEGKYKVSIGNKLTQVYNIWKAMMQRCYDEKSLQRRPSYKSVSVCKEWHNFQIFGKWFDNNHIDGWHLDKDILSRQDNKIYSPETCLFIPLELNSFMTSTQHNNRSGKAGVDWHKDANKWQSRICDGSGRRMDLGRYENKEDAIEAYKNKREDLANEWRDKMKDILPQKAILMIK